MRCPRCGDTTEDSDRFCSSCGQDLATYRNLWPQTPLGSPNTQPDEGPLSQQVETPQPGPPVTEATTERREIPTYLGWAAAVLTLCWPAFWAGVPAVVYAERAESRLAAGDTDGAWEYSQKARTWCWVNLWAGVVLWTLILTLLVTL